MLQKVKNLDTTFREVRRISIIAICASSLVYLIDLYFHYRHISKLQNQIYILADGKVMQAHASNRQANIAVEAKNHIRNFHEYFFNLDPDALLIRNNMDKALYLADHTAKIAFDSLKEQGYYTYIIGSNINQRITIDSIGLDLDRSPYPFKCYASQKLIRTTSMVTRNLITEGTLRTTSRSEPNPHGFLIENWRVIKNKDPHTKHRQSKTCGN